MTTTSKAVHTPGPWHADWDDNGQWYIEPLGVTGTKLRGDCEDCVEAANARLIAAAPELLEVLEALAAKACIKTPDAIVCRWCLSRTEIGQVHIHEDWCSLAKAEAVIQKVRGCGQ